jgi:hypothetical protein
MIQQAKAAGRVNGQAASKTPSTRDLSARKSSAPIFIQIDEHYAIGADAHSWHILECHRYKGARRWEPISWYDSLERCVNGLADKAVRTSGAQSLSQALLDAKRVPSALHVELRPSFKVEVRRDG